MRGGIVISKLRVSTEKRVKQRTFEGDEAVVKSRITSSALSPEAARHRSCHLQIAKLWLLTRTAAQKPQCQRGRGRPKQHQTFQVDLKQWARRRRAGAGGGGRRGGGGVFASEPQRRQSSHLQWNGKKKGERKEEMKKDERRGGGEVGGGGGSEGAGEAGARPAHPSSLRKGQDFCRRLLGRAAEIPDVANSRAFYAATAAKESSRKSSSASKHFGPTLGHLSCLWPRQPASQPAEREHVPAHAKK